MHGLRLFLKALRRLAFVRGLRPEDEAQALSEALGRPAKRILLLVTDAVLILACFAVARALHASDPGAALSGPSWLAVLPFLPSALQPCPGWVCIAR